MAESELPKPGDTFKSWWPPHKAIEALGALGREGAIRELARRLEDAKIFAWAETTMEPRGAPLRTPTEDSLILPSVFPRCDLSYGSDFWSSGTPVIPPKDGKGETRMYGVRFDPVHVLERRPGQNRR